MDELDRSGLIGLLERLGAESDEEALEAARALHGRVVAAGLSWDGLLRPADGIAHDAAALAGTGADAGEGPAGEMPDDDGALVEMLLARADLSDSTRETLADIQGEIVRGELDPMDRNYLRALAGRIAG